MMYRFMDDFLLALRIAILTLTVLFGALFVLLGARAALAASPKAISVITDDVIRLGDVFDNLTDNASYVLGPAPRPGEDMVLNARTLYKIAVALELPWRPSSTAEQVVLRRSATVVGQDMIKAALSARLEKEGVTGKFEPALAGAVADLILPPNEQPAVEIRAFNYDAVTGRFTAELAAPSAARPLKTATVGGQVRQIVTVPVLKNTSRNGEIVGAYDIDWVDIDSSQVQKHTVLREEDLIGMTPRRVVTGGKPVMATEIQAPRIVAKGDNVTMILDDGIMKLSSNGRAMQDGAKGDIIRVVNGSSSKTVEATITGEKEVTVR